MINKTYLGPAGVPRVHGDEDTEAFVQGYHVAVEFERCNVLDDRLLDAQHLLRDDTQYLHTGVHTHSDGV